MPNTWLISDPHLGHQKVAELRGYASVDAHDAAIIVNWARRVHVDDTVWVLGDVAFSGWKDRIGVFADLPGTKHLIAGNHDRCHPMMTNGHLYQRDFLAVFDSVSTVGTVSRDGIKAVLSHYPYSGDHTDIDRNRQWRVLDCGRPIIHGHTHSSVKVSRSAAGTLQVNVAWEAWGGLVNAADVFALIQKEQP